MHAMHILLAHAWFYIVFSLRGPRGAMVFFRKGEKKDSKGQVKINKETGKALLWNLETDLNNSTFPGLQGGPHNHTIAALAVALKLAAGQDFKNYAHQVMKNNQALVQSLIKQHGFEIVSGGSDNHLLVANVKPFGINGAKAERVLELCNLTINKNTVPGDVSAMNPGGIRMGSPAMTSRGMVEKDFEQIARFIKRGIEIAQLVDSKSTDKTMKAFRESLDVKKEGKDEIAKLHKEVVSFANTFPAIPEF
jgi:glycine hydroxymethyltransferase